MNSSRTLVFAGVVFSLLFMVSGFVQAQTLSNGAKCIVVHGAGDGSGKSDTNGGAYTGSVSWSAFQDSNGGPVDAANAAAVSDNGSGKVRITSSGSFSDSLVDIYAYCDFSDTYTDGRYLITAVDSSNNYIDIDLDYISDTTADVKVGGAMSSPQAAADAVGQGDYVKISGGPYTASSGDSIISCTVSVESGSPPYDAMQNSIVIEGVNSDGEIDPDNKVIFDCSVNNLKYGIYMKHFYGVRNIEVVGASSYGFGAGGVDNCVLEDCLARDGGNGYYFDNSPNFFRCTAINNSSYGIVGETDSKVISCISRNNGSGEVRIKSGEVMYSTISNNVAPVILLEQNSDGHVICMNNTFDGGSVVGTAGFKNINYDSDPYMFNNIFSNCDVAMEVGSDLTNSAIVYNNLFYNNTLDVGANGFITTGINPVFGDPDYEDAAAGDFRLGSNSDAIAAGFDSNSIKNADIEPQLTTHSAGDRTIVVNGSGTGADASDQNGGIFTGSAGWASFQGANGGPIAAAASASVTLGDSSNVRITSAGSFVSAIADVYAWCDFAAQYTDGRYEVVAVDPAGNYIELDLAYTADDLASVNVGGALASPQLGVDIVQSGDYVKISGGPYTNVSSGAIINCTVLVDSAALPSGVINVEGVNADGLLDWDNKVVLDCRVNNASQGVIPQPRYRISNFEVIGATGVGYGNSSVDSILYQQCVARDCGSVGLRSDNSGTFIGCQSYDNGGNGIDGDGWINVIGCITRNNRVKEVELNYGCVLLSTVSNNQSSAALLRFSEQWVRQFYACNNTLDGGELSGIIGLQIGTSTNPTSPLVLMNNIVANCEIGTYVGGDMSRKVCKMNNLYYNNVHDVDLNGNVSTGMNPIFDDPDFTDPVNGNYDLGVNSAAFDAGADSALMLYGQSGMTVGSSGIDIGSHQYIVTGPVYLAGDADMNFTVNISDFLILKGNYGTTSGAAWSQGDFDGDGDVDITDFLMLKSNYGLSY